MAVYTLNSRITIGDFKPFIGVNEVVIKRSLDDHANTAIVKLPITARLKESGKAQTQSVMTANSFSVGDRITIELGYNKELRKEFEGFIRRINMTTPMELECEGWVFQLREKDINQSWESSSLKDVIEDIVEGSGIVVEDIDNIRIDNLSIDKETGFSSLGKIRDESGNSIWLEGNKLFAGLKYTFFSDRQKNAKEDVVYKVGYNTINANDIKRKLEKEDRIITINQKNKDGTVTKVEYGSGSIKKELKADLIRNKDSLMRLTKDHYNYEKAKDWEGKIETFLEPYCKPGFKMKLIDERYPERSGNYIVESVETRFGVSGARRIIEIAFRL